MLDWLTCFLFGHDWHFLATYVHNYRPMVLERCLACRARRRTPA